MEKGLVTHLMADAADRLGRALELTMSRIKALVAEVLASQDVNSRVYRQPSHVITFEWSMAR